MSRENHPVDAQPDISEEQLNEQFERQDKQMIEMQGYYHWLENEKRLYAHLQERSPAAYEEKVKHFESLRTWAETNGFLQPKVSTKSSGPI